MRKHVHFPPPTHYRSWLHKIFDAATDLLAILSVIGVWPRYIESQSITLDDYSISIDQLAPQLEGLKILHLSDLHYNQRQSRRFHRQLKKIIEAAQADLILFTGDFLCYSHCSDWQALKEVLSSWKAPLGTYAAAGNHDYQTYATLSKGKCTYAREAEPFLLSALKKLLPSPNPPQWFETLKYPPPIHPQLKDILQQTGIELLHNDCITLNVEGAPLKITGLGDLWATGIDEEIALRGATEPRFKIVLSHNPQSWHILKKGRSQLILSGHTHGGNVKLPWLQGKLRNVDEETVNEGWVHEADNSLHISRGLSSTYPFRLGCPPHATLIKLKRLTDE